MDMMAIALAFALGFLVKQLGLPPLLGFLAAGFILNAAGINGGENLEEFAEAGVLLLLFSIGLKVRIRSLVKPEVLGVASIHMLITVALFGLGIYLLSYSALSIFTDMDWQVALLIAFALSFSSTVFTVKVMEEKGEMNSKHGRLAIGILVIQDFLAVIFITLSSGKIPSPWAVLLLLLIPMRKPIIVLLKRSGHGELLILIGLLIPLVGANLFEVVGLKPDLGALLIGMLLAGDPKSDELAKAILNFKDLLLVGFFLTIGLSGLPSLETIGVSIFLTLAIPVKVILFSLLLSHFKLRARTATLASLSLASYSEFGLIIGALGASKGWLSNEWLVIFALSVSFSFIFASPLNSHANAIYGRFHRFLRRFESKERLVDDQIVSVGDAEGVIFGMGRIGSAAYDSLFERYGKKVLGIDYDAEQVNRHVAEGRNVIQGDASDYDFWERLHMNKEQEEQVKLVLLTIPNFEANVYAAKRIREMGFTKTIASLAAFDDQVEMLQGAGVDFAYNANREAGKGFADHICEQVRPVQDKEK